MQGKPLGIHIYGCGELGLMAKSFFEFFKIPFTPVDIDPSGYENSNSWNGYQIKKIEDVPKNAPILICISNHSFNKIKKSLKKSGHTNVRSFFEQAEFFNCNSGYKHPLRSGWTVGKEFDELFMLVNDRFSDIVSNGHYFTFLKWHRSYIEQSGFPVDTKNRYFIPEVLEVLRQDEVFVDAGAYDGRVALKFIDTVRGKFKKIICIEPDMKNYKALAIKTKGVKGIETKYVALGDENGTTGFRHCFGYMSKVDKRFPARTRVKKLDSMWGVRPTIIKYHLEGHELEALQGSMKTLKKHRPIVMVTTYHTSDGAFRIPNYLMDNLKNYRFLWRNHNYMGQGAVLYCIPNERYK